MNRGTFWIAFVIALLAGNAVAMGVLLAESGDPSARVMPDYYRRAVAWDQSMADSQASADLGWAASARLVGGELEVTIAGADGAPVDRAAVTATVRHRSVATGATVTLQGGAGRYTARIAAAQPGLYVVDLVATRGAERFVSSLTIHREIR